MPNSTNSVSDFAPPAPALGPDEGWTVCVSHASLPDDAAVVWLVNLCDALRNHGHTLFIDRPATSESDRVAALDRSQAGLLFWSSSAGDATRMHQAVNTMNERAGRSAFPFVIVRTGATQLPSYASDVPVVECSLFPAGPSGGEALRLLLTLAGRPIGAAAEAAAARDDAAARTFMIPVNEKSPSADRLKELLVAGGPWETSSALGCAVAARLIGLREHDKALEVIETVSKRFARAIRPRQLRALARARRGRPGDLGDAQQILAALYGLGERDPETLGMYARTFMDDYNATGNAASLRKSRDFYAESYGLFPDNYYTGINAAAKSLFLQTDEDRKLAEWYARKVQDVVGTDAIEDDYWKTATVAEAHLILGNYDAAATVYKQAVDGHPSDTGSHASTWKQASKLMAVLRVERAVRDQIRAGFGNPPSAPLLDVGQEIRFAIVMYGGVSLAIYINGVTLEFLRLVRATAADPQDRNQPLLLDEQLTGTERVYRRAAQLLGRERDGVKRAVTDDDPIRARFVVDILSGTSAGGINAMFLAKALANNQSMDQLKQLWIDEGAIERLINDGKSVENLDGLPREKPPSSLLNGRRMYRKLLDAFDAMDRKNPVGKQPPLADELELFVTTTDIRGLPVNLRLADDVVEELRHRNVFRFAYNGGASADAANDFVAENNPFLAYAARCTSSFPFAFPPMKLTDIDDVLEHTPGREQDTGLGQNVNKWQRFFPAYVPPTSGKQSAPAVYDFMNRAFGDGGYLDNKPFGHATEALRARRGGVPSRRKLVFIEPSPEHLDKAGGNGERPNLIENVSAALSLARYETIRDDLDRVRGRNRLVERVGRIIGGMEYDIRIGQSVNTKIRSDFGTLDLRDMIALYGVAYGGYHRLKISRLTDELADLLSRIGEYDDRSDEFLAIRYLVRAWRESRFVAYLTDASDPRRTENQFLAQYDLGYRLRRLEFVIGKIDQLSAIDRVTEELFQQVEAGAVPRSEADRAAFRAELARLRGELRAVYEPLRRGRDMLLTRGAANPLGEGVMDLDVGQADLHELLKRGTDHERVTFAYDLLADPRRMTALDTLAERLTTRISELTIEASQRSTTLLAIPVTDSQPTAPAPAASGSNPFAGLAVHLVSHYYQFYERYDLIAYPVLQSSDIGEELDTVDVVRISPEDARSLIDERASDRRKLAGTKLMHFGAFLDRGWRHNDILWGRLDGAERILSTILPPDERERDELIEEAQRAILEEEYRGRDQDKLCQLLVDGLVAQRSPDANEATLQALVKTAVGAQTNERLQAALRGLLTGETLRRFFRDSYSVNVNLDPKAATQSLARSIRVISQLLEQLSADYNVGSSTTRWLSRLARIFWGLVEVGVPNSLPNLIVRHWLKLLYLFAVLLVGLGAWFDESGTLRLGVVALAVAMGITLALLMLGDIMRGRRGWLRFGALVIATPLVVALGVGVYTLASEPMRTYLWDHLMSRVF